jgi:hypothetical protein
VRIDIDEPNGYRHQIDTQDVDLAGRWLVEKCLRLMSSNAAWGDCRLRIWPSTEAESKTIGQHDNWITQDALLKLAEALLLVSAKVGEQERAAL